MGKEFFFERKAIVVRDASFTMGPPALSVRWRAAEREPLRAVGASPQWLVHYGKGGATPLRVGAGQTASLSSAPETPPVRVIIQ